MHMILTCWKVSGISFSVEYNKHCTDSYMYDFDHKPQFCFYKYKNQTGLSMKCALKWVENTDEFTHTIWWGPFLVTDCVCTSLMACRRHLMSSVGQRVNEEKNAAKKPADALAKALKSSAFWKLAISITWIVRLCRAQYHCKCTTYSLPEMCTCLSAENALNVTNYNSCHGWTYFVFL